MNRTPARHLQYNPVAIVSGLTALAWAALVVLGITQEAWKPVQISVMACVTMLVGTALAGRDVAERPALLIADGLGAGVMVTTACVFLLPEATEFGAIPAGFGLAAGLAAGIGVIQRARMAGGLWHGWAPSVVALSVHALAEGVVIGVIYTRLPEISLLLGIAIIAHKLPAGYAAGQELHATSQPKTAVLVPACMTGIAAIPIACFMSPSRWDASALFLGLSTGIFLTVALDFLVAPAKRSAARNTRYRMLGALCGLILVAGLKFGMS